MNAPKLRNGLTPKQSKFTTIILKQLKETGSINGTQAVMQSYNVKDPRIASPMASDNLSLPTIKDRLEQALAKNGITPDLITNEIKGLAVQQVEKISGDVKLKASIELLKLMGAYPGSKHARLNVNIKGNIKDMNYNQVKEELKVIDSRLAEVMNEPIPQPDVVQ